MGRLPPELRTRFKRYAAAIVRFYISLPKARKEIPVLGLQMLRSGTSVTSHTREAARARSHAEFCSKLDGALQEADETQLWVELLMEECGVKGEAAVWLLAETNELISIIVTIVKRSRGA